MIQATCRVLSVSNLVISTVLGIYIKYFVFHRWYYVLIKYLQLIEIIKTSFFNIFKKNKILSILYVIVFNYMKPSYSLGAMIYF